MNKSVQQRIAIVGSGLAGSLIAAELAPFANITVYERGGNIPVEPKVVCTGHPIGLAPSFGYGLGGTTNYWHGGLVAMNEDEFRQWPPGMQSEIGRYYPDVVRRLYGEHEAEVWNKLVRTSLNPGIVEDFILKPIRPYRGDLGGIKSHISLELGSFVRCVTETDAGIYVTVDTDGELKRQLFDKVVVCAGGINSPLLLKRSKLGGEKVCKNYIDHPMGFVGKLTRGGNAALFRRMIEDTHPQRMMKIKDEETGLWCAYYLRPTGSPNIDSDPYADSFSALGATSKIRRGVNALPKLLDADFRTMALARLRGKQHFGRHAYVLAVAEQEALGQGTISETDGGPIYVDWSISESTIASITRGLKVFASTLGAQLHEAPAIRSRLWSAAHHSGTCRVALSACEGVVDQNLRVHGTNKLYVCDASVLPSIGATNTALTIGGLALRLSDYLKAEWVNGQASLEAYPMYMTGASSNLGRYMRPSLAAAGLGVQPLDLRHDSAKVMVSNAGSMLHLAHDRRSCAQNRMLQEKVVEFVKTHNIKHVIISMSFATFGRITGQEPSKCSINFGFECTLQNEYASSKLDTEHLWCEWQKAAPDRVLHLVYVPTVLGPTSDWTSRIARHAPAKTILVPRIEPFFSVEQDDLSPLFEKIAKSVFSPGIYRVAAVGRHDSLFQTIRRDRAGDTREIPLSANIKLIVAKCQKEGWIKKVADIGLKVTRKGLEQASTLSIFPVSSEYLGLFVEQSRFNKDWFGTCEEAESNTEPSRRC